MWLDSCNIKFSRAGWKFLNMQGSSDEEEEDPDDAESDFEPSGSECARRHFRDTS